MIAVIVCLAAVSAANAQQEFPPPQGKGRVVVMGSGMAGPSIITAVARDIAELGYDVVVYDGNTWEGTHGDSLKTAITQSQQMPHALPGKVALVGFSLGGGIEMFYGVQWPDLVAGAVLWYPENQFITVPAGWAGMQQIPILLFAGGKDHYYNDCCTSAYAQTLAAASTGAGKHFELVVYPDEDHDFAKGGPHYNAKDYEDTLKRTAAQLKIYFSAK